MRNALKGNTTLRLRLEPFVDTRYMSDQRFQEHLKEQKKKRDAKLEQGRAARDA